MNRLCTEAVDCEYKECNRRMTEQFINGLDDEVCIGEIIRELTALKDINEVTSDHILMWTQRAQKEVLDNIRDEKEFYSVR